MRTACSGGGGVGAGATRGSERVVLHEDVHVDTDGDILL